MQVLYFGPTDGFYGQFWSLKLYSLRTGTPDSSFSLLPSTLRNRSAQSFYQAQVPTTRTHNVTASGYFGARGLQHDVMQPAQTQDLR